LTDRTTVGIVIVTGVGSRRSTSILAVVRIAAIGVTMPGVEMPGVEMAMRPRTRRVRGVPQRWRAGYAGRLRIVIAYRPVIAYRHVHPSRDIPEGERRAQHGGQEWSESRHHSG